MPPIKVNLYALKQRAHNLGLLTSGRALPQLRHVAQHLSRCPKIKRLHLHFRSR
ncbi:MAG: hypothetical protein NZ693_06675 [Thermoflexales bacterium]|nr:hypothetical protein [Thermoflexales bacterium]